MYKLNYVTWSTDFDCSEFIIESTVKTVMSCLKEYNNNNNNS